jgi:hypothetical protein
MIYMSLIALVLTLVSANVLSSVSAQEGSAVGKNEREVSFKVRIENISDPEGYTASDGTRWPFALSPGLWVLDRKGAELFQEGKPALMNGLEAQAEDGNPSGLIKSFEGHHASNLYGVFNTPVGANMPGPITPGAAYEFTFKASAGMKLNMAMMFGQSNDLFYAPARAFDLFDSKGLPVSGDITRRFVLWNAGTERDEEPGVGANQAPRQKAPNTGDAENGVVRRAKDVRFYDRTKQLLRVTITPAQ